MSNTPPLFAELTPGSAPDRKSASKIRVLVVDDYSFMRSALMHILKRDPVLEVVGTAADGEQAVREVERLRPDVVLMDVQMPKMDGLQALAQIMAKRPTPTLIISGLDRRDGNLAVQALLHGAVDFVAKPSGVVSYDIERVAAELIGKIKLAAGANVRAFELRSAVEKSYLLEKRPPVVVGTRLVVMGASTGGPHAISEILRALPSDFGAAVIVAQHMSREMVPFFATSLRAQSRLGVRVATERSALCQGIVLIAPGDCDIQVFAAGKSGHEIALKKQSGGKVHTSIDQVMQSAATAYGPAALGVLLTGVGADGAQGMRAIKQAGGATIAEDASSCVVYGMPRAAIELGVVDAVIPLPQIAAEIIKRVSGRQPTKTDARGDENHVRAF